MRTICCLWLSLTAGAQAQAPTRTFTTFDVPGAGTGINQGTIPYSINAAGTITGYYLDSKATYHGFLRDAAGGFTTFDVPGADTNGTFPISINAEGTVTGAYTGPQGTYGFVRDASAAIDTFGVPYAGSLGTYPYAINSAGAVAGYYLDANQVLRLQARARRRHQGN